MSLFNGFKKKSIKSSESNKNKLPDAAEDFNKVLQAPADEVEQYYFENLVEFTLYAELYAKAKNKKVIWLKGDDYNNEYQRAFQLYNQGKYKDVIKVCKDSFKLNPIAISARFEMCEAYLKLHNLKDAKRTLLEMKDFMATESLIARYYRRLGFVEIELGNYKTAAACYQYSQKFENHPSIAQELMYIISKAGKGVVSKIPEAVLEKSDLPVLIAKKTN